MSTRLLILLLALLATQALSGECPSYFDEVVALELHDAKNIQQLEKIYRSQSYPDRVIDIVYAMKRRALAPSSSLDAILNATPRNPTEFWSAYHLTDPRIASRRPSLSALFEDYIHELAAAVSTPSATDESMRRYLLLTIFADGEIAEFLAEENSHVARADPKVFHRVVKGLKANERQRICENAPCAGSTP
jgi:hypothetical protein